MKKPPILVVVLLVFSQISFPTPSGGCPVVPSLWRSVAQADLIVLARVASVEADPTPGDPSYAEPSPDRQTVVLEILDTWKGTSSNEVRVDFQSSAPQSYAVGTTMVAFLERGETRALRWREAEATAEAYVAGLPEDGQEGDETLEVDLDWSPADQAAFRAQLDRFAEWSAGRWFDVSSSEEIRIAAEGDQDALKELIERAVRLQADGGPDAEHRDWIVSAVERRATRPHGLFELEPDALTNEQLARIAAGLAREPAVDETDLFLLQALAAYPDPEVDRAAAAIVEAGLRIQPIPEWVPEMVAETLRRYGDDFAARIGRDDVDSRGRPIYTGPGQNTLPTIWEVARRDLGIPEVTPAEKPD